MLRIVACNATYHKVPSAAAPTHPNEHARSCTFSAEVQHEYVNQRVLRKLMSTRIPYDVFRTILSRRAARFHKSIS